MNNPKEIEPIQQIEKMVVDLKLPTTIVPKTLELMKSACKKGFSKGRTLKLTATCALYTVLQQEHLYRPVDTLVKASGFEKKNLLRSFKLFLRTTGIRIHLPSPAKIVPYYCGCLNLSKDVEMKAIQFLEIGSRKKKLDSQQPSGLAITAVYIAARLLEEAYTIQGIVEGLEGISQATISKYRDFMLSWLGLSDEEKKKVLKDAQWQTGTKSSNGQCIIKYNGRICYLSRQGHSYKIFELINGKLECIEYHSGNPIKAYELDKRIDDGEIQLLERVKGSLCRNDDITKWQNYFDEMKTKHLCSC